MPIFLWSTVVTQSTSPPRGRPPSSSAGTPSSVVAMVSGLRARSGPAAGGRAAPARRQEAFELVLRHDPDPEQHLRVAHPAELGALAVVEAHPLEVHVELVGGAGDRLAFEQRPRDVEGVHHVSRGRLKVDRAPAGDPHPRPVAGPPMTWVWE